MGRQEALLLLIGVMTEQNKCHFSIFFFILELILQIETDFDEDSE